MEVWSLDWHDGRRRACSFPTQGFHRPIYTSSLEGVTLASDQGVAGDLRGAWETIPFQYEASA